MPTCETTLRQIEVEGGKMRGINKGTGIAKYMTVSRVFLFGTSSVGVVTMSTSRISFGCDMKRILVVEDKEDSYGFLY